MDSHSHEEEAIEVPVERIPPDTLYNMLADYVSREWSELTDAGFTHEDKIEQVQQQLKTGKARVLFDFKTSTWNIVSVDSCSKME